MALKERIADEMKIAMKSGDKLRLETLRSIRAALMEKEIELKGNGKTITPDDETGVLNSASKKRRESIEQFEKGGRLDLVDQEKKELAIILHYLPAQMSVSEVAAVIEAAVAQSGVTGAADFGKVMSLVMKQLKGKADGKMIQDMVKKRLGAA